MGLMRIQKILYPVDFSNRARGAVNFVEEFVGRFQAELTLLHVVEPNTYNDTMDKASDRKKQLDSFLPSDFDFFNVKRVLLYGDPAVQIVDYAHSDSFDLIMMATHGYGPYRRFLLGSTAAKVLHDADCLVWNASHLESAPPVEKISIRNILCAVDLNPQGLKTLHWGRRLAEEFQAKLAVLHVIAEPGLEAGVRADLEKMQNEAGTRAPVYIERGDIADHVQTAADRLHADLALIGRSSDTGAFGRLRKNSYAIIRQTRCPVISV
jgi:nucleotide-binding universal stress UspA family protein